VESQVASKTSKESESEFDGDDLSDQEAYCHHSNSEDDLLSTESESASVIRESTGSVGLSSDPDLEEKLVK